MTVQLDQHDGGRDDHRDHGDEHPWGDDGHDRVVYTFITPMPTSDGPGPRLAVKDCIDVAGVPTTVGCPAVAATAQPAAVDAACLAGSRAAGARIIGKTNLHELCFGATGINPHYGTPTNPLDPDVIPGGSSSGSAVAVANGEADIAFGTDTAGSVRNPAACCGVVGLKTTYGRVPLEGIWPLAPSLDTVGPLAGDVAGVVQGMALLEPGFQPAAELPTLIGRFRGVEADPRIDAAVDAALAASGIEIVDIALPGWSAADAAGRMLMYAEALEANAAIYPSKQDLLGDDVAERFAVAERISTSDMARVRDLRAQWRDELAGLLETIEVFALPAYPIFPPIIGQHEATSNTAAVAISFGGVPAMSMPVPTIDGPETLTGASFPAGLQLVAAWNCEEVIVALAARIEESTV